MSNLFLQIDAPLIHWIFIAFLCFMGMITFFYHRIKRKYVRAEKIRKKLESDTRDRLLEMQKIENQPVSMRRIEIDKGLQHIEPNEPLSEIVRKTRKHIGVDMAVNDDERAKIIHALKKSGAAKQWDEFELRILQAHLDFNKKIQELSPGLSSTERRLCHFLLLDLSTKEIATITGQSKRAVELSRIRLRKKLGLTNRDTSLFEFLSKI